MLSILVGHLQICQVGYLYYLVLILDENFLAEFYNNSRLHHISTMGANFKSYVADLRNNDSAFKFAGQEKLLQMAGDHQVRPLFTLLV